MKRQRQEFLENEALKQKIWNEEKREKREKKKAAKAKQDKLDKECFDRKLASAKKEQLLATSHNQTQETTIESSSVSNTNSSVASPVKPPAKKKKTTKSRSSKKLAKQSNKLTDYYKKSTKSIHTNDSVASPHKTESIKTVNNTVSSKSDSFISPPPPHTVSIKTAIKTASSTASSNPDSFMSPPANHHNHHLTTTVTPYTGTNIDSSYVTDTKASTAGLDLTRICTGCNRPFNMCFEGKWRKICLHRVLDYLEAKDFDGATERGVRKVYYNTFMIMMKAKILDDTDLYELKEHIHLPECMRSGSLNEAFELKDFESVY